MKDEKPKWKIAVLIAALLLLIVGMVSCTIRMKHPEPTPPAAIQTENPLPSAESDADAWNANAEKNQPEPDADSIPPDAADPTPDDPAANKPGTNPTPANPRPVKPTEPAKPTPAPILAPTPKPTPTPKPPEPTKPPVKPELPDKPGGGSGGGGDYSYPAAAVEIIVPEYSHVDTAFSVKTVLRNVKSLEWAVTLNDRDASPKGFFQGTLDKDGGNITISKPGEYTLTAAARNYGNRTYTFTRTICIHSIFEIGVETEQYTHTDKEFEVKTSLSDNVTQQLNWHIYRDGSELKWDDAVTGTLSNKGGAIQIKEAGSYSLRAVAYDGTSREFSGKADIIVLPVVEINLRAPDASHTDTPAVISVGAKEQGELNIAWSATKDGSEIPLPGCIDGTLNNEGGSVLFKEKGAYSLSASITDRAGRVFSSKVDLQIYPVASFSFALPSAAHTDEAVNVAVASSELQDMKAEWTVLYNGKIAPPESALEGSLTNEGGAIRFKEKGTYILKAVLTDDLGREYSHETGIVVYPVAGTGFYLPPQTHTDTTIEVRTSFQETDGLIAEWSLTKDGAPIALADALEGTLTDMGGNIRFKETGTYELKAAVTDDTGRSFSYTCVSTVYPVITLSMELPVQTHTDKPVAAALSAQNMGNLPVEWSAVKNNVAADVTGGLTNQGGTLSLTEKGAYTITASVTDAAGRIFSTDKGITVYPIPRMTVVLPGAAHTDDVLSLNVETQDMEGLTAIWSVDNTFGFQNWDTYIDGELRNSGGSIQFRRAGVYDLEACVTDATGRIFRFDSNKIEILPVLSLSFELPATGYTDTQIDVRTRGNNGVLPIEWTLMKNGETIPLGDGISGALNAQGGKILFTDTGEYRLTATMFDALGRVFSASRQIGIYPLYNCSFTMPSTIHTGQGFEVAIGNDASLGGKNIAWTASKDGQSIPVSDSFKGALGDTGGTVHLDAAGSYQLTATITDELGRAFTHTQTITATNSAPLQPTLAADVTRIYANGKFLVNLTAVSVDPDGDVIAYEYDGKVADDYYALGSYTIKVRAKDAYGGVSDWASVSFTVVNSAPAQPTATANVDRGKQKDGNFLVTISVGSTDPDGDPIIYEYDGKAADDYYPIGTYTVRIRVKDSCGGVSEWSQVTFTVANSAPTRPEITRTPAGNSVVPGTPVTIKASSTDPDGDPITYIWDGRGAETATYPLGKNTVQVKAVDSFGAESPWAAIVFFVMDNNGSGGMMLTGPESVILENGVEGATITSWTFNVPEVAGHNAVYDYGEVRGYNKLNGQWERLTNVSFNTSIGGSFAATDGNVGRVYSNNGVYMSGTLNPGVYSKLQFYYYTPHTCMYNKSNITFTVSYYFE